MKKKFLDYLTKGMAASSFILSTASVGQSEAYLGESFFRNVLYYLGYLNPYCWFKYFSNRRTVNKNLNGNPGKIVASIELKTNSKKNEKTKESVCKDNLTVTNGINKVYNNKITREAAVALAKFEKLYKERKEMSDSGFYLHKSKERNSFELHVARLDKIIENDENFYYVPVFQIYFKDKEIEVCGQENENFVVLEKISFEDDFFDEKIGRLLESLERIYNFFGKLLRFERDGFLKGEIINVKCGGEGKKKFVFSAIKELKSDREENKKRLVNVAVSEDYRLVELSFQENKEEPVITTTYDLFKVNDVDSLFSDFRSVGKPISFDPANIILENEFNK